MALQSNADLHLRNELLTFSSVISPLFPICNFAFINIYLYTIPTICFLIVANSHYFKYAVHKFMIL
jgi:hypothetical protein